jgi:two-component system phosphate regulon sensor histidine kinase PhoR
MNNMAAQLNERLQTITRQRNELEGVLSSMIESVLVIDTDEKILRFNKAAGLFFEIDSQSAKGKHIQEVIRNNNLLRFIRRTLSKDHSIEKDIILQDEKDQFLQAHGTILRTETGEIAGALIVLHNITRLKRLENVRKDFVANVSHELKTPITAIQGSVETLRDGALENPKDADRFLDIILKHAERLNTIIEDLLSLSRIEQESEKQQIVLVTAPVRPVLENAITLCEMKSTEKSIRMELVCEPDMEAEINNALLEEAVINLIDNAIKYSEPGSRIRIKAVPRGEQVVITVQDWGSGIPREHLSRIFERFYRVDKARSRSLGGTGLGLAIVKHIVQAHKGNITVESTPAQGSTFAIHLPLP